MDKHWTPVALTYNSLKAGSIDGTDDDPHDRAILRAMQAKYKPNKHVVGDPEKTIFIGRLSPNTDEELLETHFTKFGKIKRLRLVRDLVTGFSRCYGFIEYSDHHIAYDAQKHADKTILDEKEIYVDFECERTLKGWVPRRLGGGIAGKKESGQLRFGGKNRPFKKPYNMNTMQAPDGNSFRDRLRAVETGEHSNYDRNTARVESGNSYRTREHYDGSYGDRHRNQSQSRDRFPRDRYKRSRSRDKRSRSKDRISSSSRDKVSSSRGRRSRSREKRSRSRDRSSRRH